MTRHMLVSFLLLAGCGAPSVRLTDEQAAAEQNAAIEETVAIDVPPASPTTTSPPPVHYKALGTSWAVTAINGQATPGGARPIPCPSPATKLAARFGCNSIAGGYRLNGDHLATSRMLQTQIGCAEPAGTFERRGNAVLGSNMRIERVSGTAMRLVSEAGSIDLRRAI